jgi:hypothetical protein
MTSNDPITAIVDQPAAVTPDAAVSLRDRIHRERRMNHA